MPMPAPAKIDGKRLVALIACVVLPSTPLAPPVINDVAGVILFVIGGLLWLASRPAKTKIF